MERLTYKQAYDKIIEAYFKDQIEPMSMQFCFCGTLCCGVKERDYNYYWDDERYSEQEYLWMEDALMEGLGAKRVKLGTGYDTTTAGKDKPDYEDRLFKGMSMALDELKEIHRSRGENVDETVIPFTKRQLV